MKYIFVSCLMLFSLLTRAAETCTIRVNSRIVDKISVDEGFPIIQKISVYSADCENTLNHSKSTTEFKNAELGKNPIATLIGQYSDLGYVIHLTQTNFCSGSADGVVFYAVKSALTKF